MWRDNCVYINTLSLQRATHSLKSREKIMLTKENSLTKKTCDLRDTEQRYIRACRQIALLNKHIKDMRTRHSRAKTDGNIRFRYNLNLRISTMEGMRSMYLEYVDLKAGQVAELRYEIRHTRKMIELEEYDTETESETDDEE